MNVERVMLVDDEDDIRRIGELSLARVGGWQVTLASSGTEALDKVEAANPDLILLDVMMPGMDGPQTMVKLRASEATRDIPIIFITAKVQRKEVQRYMDLGAVGVIAKPFDPMTLPNEVKRIAESL